MKNMQTSIQNQIFAVICGMVGMYLRGANWSMVIKSPGEIGKQELEM